MLVKVVAPVLLAGGAVLGDLAVERLEGALSRAFADNLTHAILGALTWATVVRWNRDALGQIALCAIAASLIDLDHFIAAKSFKLQDVHQLKFRPFLHCSSLAALLSLLLILLSYLSHCDALHTLGWISVAAFTSHHTRDATRRGYWLYPAGSTPPVPYWGYIAIISLILPYTIAYLYLWSKSNRFSQNVIFTDKDSFIV